MRYAVEGDKMEPSREEVGVGVKKVGVRRSEKSR